VATPADVHDSGRGYFIPKRYRGANVGRREEGKIRPALSGGWGVKHLGSGLFRVEGVADVAGLRKKKRDGLYALTRGAVGQSQRLQKKSSGETTKSGDGNMQRSLPAYLGGRGGGRGNDRRKY